MLPLGSAASAHDQKLVEAFRQGLRDSGLREHRDFVLDVLWVTGSHHDAVGELLERGATLLVPCGSTASVAAQRRTIKIPILFISVGNPVRMGLVESLTRPGGNATGFSDVLADLSGKYVEIAQNLSAKAAAVGYFWHTNWPDGQYRFLSTERAAQSLGVVLKAHGVGELGEVDNALALIKGVGATAVIVQPGPFTYQQRVRIIEAITKQGMASIYPFPVAGHDGAVVSYGPDYPHMYRRAASYVDKLLNGMHPADLPIQEPVVFELIINLRTAKAIGLAVPSQLLARADEVIE